MESCSHSHFAGSSRCLRQLPHRFAVSRPLVQTRCQAPPRGTEFGKESRIGKAPILIPKGVQLTLTRDLLKVKGPKGELELAIPEIVEIEQQGDALRVFKTEASRKANEVHGLIRALANNMVVGTSTGWTKTLSLVGVGYRASVSGSKLILNLGYSHPIEMDFPKGVTVAVEKQTTVVISGYDKEQVGQFAAKVRAKRPPEPYKQKGVRYVDEVVRKKEGKRGK
ncbi:g3319 [Coccomyxa elongata]